MTEPAPRSPADGDPWTRRNTRALLITLGLALVVYGVCAVLVGHANVAGAYAENADLTLFNEGAETARVWMWSGVGALVFGGVMIVTQLFLSAYLPDAAQLPEPTRLPEPAQPDA